MAQAAAEEGRYFIATNPTPGTGLATIAALASLADTSPFIMMRAQNRMVVLDYLRLTYAVLGTGAASVRFAAKTDAAKAAPTGGTAITPVNVNQGATLSPDALVYAGALVAGAAVSARLAMHAQLRAAAPVAGDSYTVRFGGTGGGPVGALLTTGTAQTFVNIDGPPVLCAPGQTIQLHPWFPSQTAASQLEFELGYYEI